MEMMPMQLSKVAVFEVIQGQDALVGEQRTVSVPGELRDEDWSGRFGKVQKEVLDAPSMCSILLDLSNTTWMDPLPTLSLAILLQQRYNQTGNKSRVLVGNGGKEEQTVEHRRLLKFLATQGFLKSFQESCNFLWGPRVLDFDKMLPKYCELDYPVRYPEPNCILAEVIDLEAESELERLVQGLVQQARTNAIDVWFGLTTALRDQTCHMLHGILTELLLNIKDHAYPNIPKKYAGIYARIRRPKPSGREESKVWDVLRRLEDDSCPSIKCAEISPSDSWLELFLCDLGVGLCHNLNQWPAPGDDPEAAALLKEAAKSRSPLKQLSKFLFHKAVSSKTRHQSNQVTGLQQVGYLLNFQKDFIRIHSGGEWVGDRMPWLTALFIGAKRISGRIPYASLGAVTGGTHYGIILRPGRELPDYPSEYWIPHTPEKIPDGSILSQALTCPPLVTIPSSIFPIDQRSGEVEWDFPKKLVLPQETEDGGMRILLRKEIHTLLWLPAIPVGKRNLFDWIWNIFGPINAPPGTGYIHNVDRLIIADVERHVGIYLGWLMTSMRGRAGKRLEVCLVTRDWAVSCFIKEKDELRFSFNKEATQHFLTGTVDDVGAVAHLLRLLRHMDSTIFWETITNSLAGGESDVFVKEWVDWFENPKDEKFKLGGYLDFAQALADPVRMEICQRAVLRTANALGSWRIYPADDLARSVLIRTGRLVSGTHASDCEAIALGSVYVTGSTQRQLENRKDICIKGQMAVLRNPYKKSSSGEESTPIATALDWIPVPDIGWSHPPNELPYCRIPDTPFICRGGEDFQPLPRFKINHAGNELKSIYGQSPKDAYEVWHRLGVLKLGHWVYNERHDLLTINLERAYLLDALKRGEISTWIRDSLKHYFHSALMPGKSTLSALAHILVYPSHPVTDRIVQDMGRLYPDLLCGITVIPFKFLLGRHAVSPMRISPLTEERLRKVIALHAGGTSQKGGVVVFDDGTVTGKVFRELTLLIMSMGAVNVYRMALLDRSGLPIHREMSEKFTAEHRRLWRWDVPDLGQKRSCPLCHTLDLVKDIRETNSNDLTRKRLDEWLVQWAPRSVADSWELAGWSGHVITDCELGKQRFGIIHPITSGEGADQAQPPAPLVHEVIHPSSTSLSAMTVELRRSTTNRAYPQRKANAVGNYSTETRMEILCTQLLLFFDEMELPVKKSYLTDILKWLWQVDEDTPISALAGLCMGLVDDRLARELQPEIDKYLTSPLPAALDPLLALGLLRKRTKFLSVKSSTLAITYSKNQDVHFALTLLFSTQEEEEKAAMRTLFLILRATNREGHNSPLRTALIEPMGNDNSNLMQRVLKVQINLNGLRQALLRFPAIFFRLTETAVPNPQEHAVELQNFINELQSIRGVPYLNLPGKISQSLSKIKNFLYGIKDTPNQGIAKHYWNLLTMKVSTDTMIDTDFRNYIATNVLSGAGDKISKEYKNLKELKDDTVMQTWLQDTGEFRQFSLFCMNDRKWEKSEAIFLPSFMFICLRDVILNGIHADAMIRNPRQPNNEKVAHMWYDIDMETEGVTFRFINACRNPNVVTPKLDIYFGMLRHFGGKTTGPSKIGDQKPIHGNGLPLDDRTLIEITLTIPTLTAVIGRST